MARVGVRAATGEDYEIVAQRAISYFHGSVLETRRAATFYYADRPIAVFGATIRWQGVADLWGVVSEEARGAASLSFVRECNAMLEGFAREENIRRLAAWVFAAESECQRFARLFKFECEHVDKGAAPNGDDLMMYVRRWDRG